MLPHPQQTKHLRYFELCIEGGIATFLPGSGALFLSICWPVPESGLSAIQGWQSGCHKTCPWTDGLSQIGYQSIICQCSKLWELCFEQSQGELRPSIKSVFKSSDEQLCQQICDCWWGECQWGAVSVTHSVSEETWERKTSTCRVWENLWTCWAFPGWHLPADGSGCTRGFCSQV